MGKTADLTGIDTLHKEFKSQNVKCLAVHKVDMYR